MAEINAQLFIAENKAELQSSRQGRQLLDEVSAILKRLHRNEDLANIATCRRILGHSYGYELALKFRRWIDTYYHFDNKDGAYNESTDKVEALPSDKMEYRQAA